MLLVLFKRFLGSRSSSGARDAKQSPEQIITKIQGGDIELLEQFITDYQPYVMKMASRFARRFIDPSRDDEFNIALTAFYEAINQYSAASGAPFFSFAETVVRRRLIDYVRREQRFTKQTPFSAFEQKGENEQDSMNVVEVQQAMEQFNLEGIAIQRKDEIMELNAALSEYGITFSDLVKCSPKHVDSRRSLQSIGSIVANNRLMLHHVLIHKTLPIKQILGIVKVSRKTIERNRKYIIATALIYSGPYPAIQDYLKASHSKDEG